MTSFYCRAPDLPIPLVQALIEQIWKALYVESFLFVICSFVHSFKTAVVALGMKCHLLADWNRLEWAGIGWNWLEWAGMGWNWLE